MTEKKPMPTWMRATHYHCKFCGAEVSFIMRIAWNETRGVCALGICEWCYALLAECEKGKLKWRRQRYLERKR